MADNLGIKVSQVGTDVERASDAQLLFSSSWPLLKIALEDSYTIASDETQVICDHNRNYFPAFFVEDNTNGYAESNPNLNNALGISQRQLLYFGGRTGGLSFPLTIHYSIYLLDLTREFRAPITSTSVQPTAPGAADFGIKVSKPGKDVDSTDYRDFTVHSGTQSPMIHQVATTLTTVTTTAGSSVPGILADHQLGYYPLMFPYYESLPGYFFFTGNYSQSVPRVFGTTSSTQLELPVSPNRGALVIFKDPFQIILPTTTVAT